MKLTYLKVFFVYIYTNIFCGKYFYYFYTFLVILWTHLLVWLLYDVTVVAVSYFNAKHSVFFLKEWKELSMKYFINIFKKKLKLKLFKHFLALHIVGNSLVVKPQSSKLLSWVQFLFSQMVYLEFIVTLVILNFYCYIYIFSINFFNLRFFNIFVTCLYVLKSVFKFISTLIYFINFFSIYYLKNYKIFNVSLKSNKLNFND